MHSSSSPTFVFSLFLSSFLLGFQRPFSFVLFRCFFLDFSSSSGTFRITVFVHRFFERLVQQPGPVFVIGLQKLAVAYLNSLKSHRLCRLDRFPFDHKIRTGRKQNQSSSTALTWSSIYASGNRIRCGAPAEFVSLIPVCV